MALEFAAATDIFIHVSFRQTSRTPSLSSIKYREIIVSPPNMPLPWLTPLPKLEVSMPMENEFGSPDRPFSLGLDALRGQVHSLQCDALG